MSSLFKLIKVCSGINFCTGNMLVWNYVLVIFALVSTCKSNRKYYFQGSACMACLERERRDTRIVMSAGVLVS